eukprot:TRINITY_DN110863_c0_g1_i1.p1 TRINITY_DN110863_c0_g1~~TRINITY_DN110863_c0_g1_i1.p1  ORF type:complete len:363 (+),score=70.50 TRINITY_DN110863_c0_g1_i1:184-1272(+)
MGGDWKSCLPCGGSSSGPTISSAPPVVVAVSGAAGQIGYSLLPMIANGDMFGASRRVIIRGLDLKLPSTMDNMRAIEMELLDSNFPLLVEATLSSDEKVVFKDADYAILLGAFPRQEGKEDREIMEKNVTIFRTMGKAIQDSAKPSCRVLVSGNPANTNAFIVSHYATKLPKANFFSLSRLDYNRAIGQLAKRAKAGANDVRNVVLWGRHCEPPDYENATIHGKTVKQVLSSADDEKWLRRTFLETVMTRGQEVQRARKASSAMSAARSIAQQVHDLHCGTRGGEHVSMGVWSDGNPYGVTNGIFFSFPVICRAGQWKVVPGLKVDGADTKKIIHNAETGLKKERDLAVEVIRKHDRSGKGA